MRGKCRACAFPRGSARRRQRGLRVTVRCEALEAGIADDALEIVLSALLDNVVEHAGTGRIVVISGHREGEQVILVVSDDGPAVAPGDAERLFEPFFTTARESGGTGLGLAIARAILTGAGGRIDLVPSAAAASFRILLPQA